MSDKAFLPAVLDMATGRDDEEYARVAIAIACHAGGMDAALELGDMLGLPSCSWGDARDLLATERAG